MQEYLRRYNRQLAVILVALFALTALYYGVVEAVNYVTRNDPAQYVTNQTCGFMKTEARNNTRVRCEEPLLCFNIQEHEKSGIETPRCVEPEFVEGRCGYLEGYMVLQSWPATFGGCGVQEGVLKVIPQIPGGIQTAWGELQANG
jgi:hypothetical protein